MLRRCAVARTSDESHRSWCRQLASRDALQSCPTRRARRWRLVKASIAAPRYFRSVDKAKDNTLQTSLNVMRDAIDQFAADKARYPESLAELVAQNYLRAVPEDPLTNSTTSWVAVAPPPGALFKGRLHDVRSGMAGRAPDGRLYADW